MNNNAAPLRKGRRSGAGGRLSRVRNLLGSVRRRARIASSFNALGVLGVLLVLSILLTALFAPLIAPYNPTELNPRDRLQPPSLSHFFGTDAAGRDVFSRVVFGSRISLMVAGIVIVIAVVLGGLVGITAALCGGVVDEVLMRSTDIFLAFPPLILAMAVNAGLGPGIMSAILAVGFTWWPAYARMIRGQILVTKSNLYVEAAHAMGAPRWRVVAKHILPNCISPTIVQITLDAGAIILTTAGLSFIGLGAQPPTPEWGSLISEGHGYILTSWWWPTFPGLVLCTLVIGLNLLGDFLRDIQDPRLGKVRG